MSKKKDRAWFLCPRWADLISEHYGNDVEAARALKVNPKVLLRLRSGTPVAKSTLLNMLRRYGSRHDLSAPISELVVDTRSRRSGDRDARLKISGRGRARIARSTCPSQGSSIVTAAPGWLFFEHVLRCSAENEFQDRRMAISPHHQHIRAMLGSVRQQGGGDALLPR